MERWEVLVKALAERTSTANENSLTPRCWKFSTLSREIKCVVKANKQVLRTTFPTAGDVVERLKRMGLVHPVEAKSPKEAETIQFLLLDMGGGKTEPLYPLELLQAYLPDGVISYFSAIDYYELTTQPVTHHHVARLGSLKSQKNRAYTIVPELQTNTDAAERNLFGTEIFNFENVAYYVNRRDQSLVPGVQFRVVAPRCWLRITTLEQTLLDGLMQSIRCGGEAVVLEAWETGVKQIDADRMADHLNKIQREDLDRRVGAILEMLGASFSSSALWDRLSSVKNRLRAEDTPEIPLLTGLEFSESNHTWKVQTP